MTAFNCASYLSLIVPSQRDGLDLLRRGSSSHRQQGNLGLSTSLYTPCIVRFCSLNPTISACFLLVAACTLERGLSSESNSVSGPPTPSMRPWAPFPFECDPLRQHITGTGFHRAMLLVEERHRGLSEVVFRRQEAFDSIQVLVCLPALLLVGVR